MGETKPPACFVALAAMTMALGVLVLVVIGVAALMG